jgi:hypothetical protein
MRTRTSETFNTKICLQLPDEDAYRSILNAPRSLKPLSIFGRGIVGLEDGQYEFQTAYICDPLEINNHVKQTSQSFKRYNYEAKPIPVLPAHVTLNYVEKEMTGLAAVPIGMNTETKDAYIYDFKKNKINVIATNDLEENINFFHALITLLKTDQTLNIRVIDVLEMIDSTKVDIKVYNENLNEVITAIRDEIENEANAVKNHLYIILGISELKKKLNNDAKDAFNDIFDETGEYKNTNFIIADNYNEYKNFQSEIDSEINRKAGIWLGYGVDNQFAIDFPELSMEDRKIMDPNIGFVPFKSSRIVFKKIALTEEDTNE